MLLHSLALFFCFGVFPKMSGIRYAFIYTLLFIWWLLFILWVLWPLVIFRAPKKKAEMITYVCASLGALPSAPFIGMMFMDVGRLIFGK